MDTITHALAGAAIAMAARKKVGKSGAVAVMAAAVAPDLDMVLRLAGSEVFLKYHRVALNSLPGAVAISLICAGAAWWFGSYKKFWPLWGICLGTVGLHVLMDLTNSYGAKPLWPLDDKWRAMDMVFIIDPWITGLLVAAIVAMKFSGKRTLVLAGCCALLLSYWGMRAYLHHHAAALCKVMYPEAMRVGAFPAPVNPFKWRMVAETKTAYWTGWYNVLDGEWDSVEIYNRPEPDKAIKVARQARNAKIFLEFARFPWTSYMQDADGWTVSFQDLRFAGLGGGRGFVVRVHVNHDGTTDDGTFSFREQD